MHDFLIACTIFVQYNVLAPERTMAIWKAPDGWVEVYRDCCGNRGQNMIVYLDRAPDNTSRAIPDDCYLTDQRSWFRR